MGLFNDNVNPGRKNWTYVYTGEELLPYAINLYNFYYDKEKEAREKASNLMKDMKVSNNDSKLEEAKRDAASYGSLREQCSVFKHEFSRKPEKEYHLGLGDVTFFGLQKE